MRLGGASCGVAAGLVVVCAWAQGPGDPVPVRFTEAVERTIRRAVTLPGSVESRSESRVAAEVAGRVAEIAAREGDAVAAGQPLARLDTLDLELRQRAVAGQLREARARLELAERNLERASDLLDDGVVSRERHDDAVSESNAWRGRLEALTAEAERVEADIERCTIRAPFAGTVVVERTEVGQWVRVGDPVAELVAPGRLEVRVEVPERYYPLLEPGTPATLAFESLPDTSIAGRVSAVIPSANPRARTFPVKVAFAGRGARIGVGMLARIGLPLGEPYDAVLVPKDAVISQGPRRMVYRINGDDTVEPVPVEPAPGVGAWAVIEGGIEPGQRVVTRGNERLRPGLAVRGTPLGYDLP